MMFPSEEVVSNLPNGFITGPLQYDLTINIQTGLANTIWESNF